MTAQVSAGIQRPRPPSVAVGVVRPLSRTASFANQSPIGPSSKQVVIDLTDNDQGERGQDRPAKRLKLDHAIEAANTPASRSDEDGRRAGVTPYFKPPTAPAWGFQERIHESSHADLKSASVVAQVDATQLRPASPPPLPIRPWKYGPRSGPHNEPSKSRESLRTGEVQTIPYSLEVPSSTPRYKQDKPVDFFPWAGNHPEDVLNEQTTKQGHYDRVQLAQNETNTARPSLYTMFKNRPNLQALSSIFISALEQRQTHGKIASASTFKPPPRVTLTDTKREAWLRDLANPSVPLRKLSRTIPHGIRGKSLLEQCLGKAIPIGRALWLAKCVGANEIRAFKRKGAGGVGALGGETKWVRDWTICVEQFVDSVVGSCGEANWREKFTYATALSARLYTEHLLDHHHYLGWVLSSLESTALDKLPIWLSTLQVYCKDLLRDRKPGRQFVSLLLEKLRHLINLDANDAFTPVIQRLSELIRTIAISHPSCFILRDTWHQIRNTLTLCLDLKEPQQLSLLEHLMSRNALVGLERSRRGQSRSLSVRETIIATLDAARAPYDLGALSEQLLGLLDGDLSLVRVVLEWSSTVFREGKTRIYLAVRLFRSWQKNGIDTDTPILDVLADSKIQQHLHAENFFHLISELVRSRSFAIGKYLQWLMARGALNQPAGQAQRWDIRLLSELPQHRIAEHVWNLRNTLLARAGIPDSDDLEISNRVKDTISYRLPQIFPSRTDHSDTSERQIPKLHTLHWSVRSEIGQWIRKHVSSHYKMSILGNTGSKDGNVESEVSALTPEEFLALRDILEELEDDSMLADVLDEACDTEDVTVLASIADTVCYHFASLAAIGAHDGLYQSLLEGYQQIKMAELPTGTLIPSLIELGKRIPHESMTVSNLRQDLSKSYQNAAIAACSPVSDHMAGSLQFDNVNFLDEFEQFLGTGNRMDEQTMLKSFEALSDRLISYEDFDHGKSSRLHLLLSQVRTYHEKQFDNLMLKWVSMLSKKNFTRLDRLIAPLIGTGCLSFEALFSVMKGPVSQPVEFGGAGPRTQLFYLILSAFKVGNSPLETEVYRFRIAQQRYLTKRPSEVLTVIREATIEYFDSQGIDRESPLSDAATASILRDYIVHYADLVSEHLVQPLINYSAATKVAVEQGVGILLNHHQHISNFDLDPVNDAKDAVRLLNDFSLPFCRLKLELTCGQGKETLAGGDTAFCEVMFETAKSNARAGMSQWIDVVSMLDARVAQYVREKAEDQFMAIASTEDIFEAPQNETQIKQEQEAALCLDIVEEMSQSIPEAGVLSIGHFLIERFHLLLPKLAAAKSDYENNAAPPKPALALFFLLLRLCLLHRTTFTNRRTSSLDLARLILSITTLAHSPSVQSSPTLPSFAFDVAACLVDDLAEETRLQTARFLKEKSRDPRLMFLFGYQEEESDALQISQKGRLWPWPLRSWEMLEEPTPMMGANDTAVSLGLFQARKV